MRPGARASRTTAGRSCRAAVGLLCLVALGASACVSALKEPPSVQELSGVENGAPAAQSAMLMVEAQNRFATREEPSVREAADLWLEAAGSDGGGTEAWIAAARALVWLANHVEDREERKAAAESAVHAAQWCRRGAPEDAGCAMWLAIALGVQARERRTTGLDALHRMLELLQSAIERDPTIEEGGPHRVLALVYLRAPGWPAGPGDPDLGYAQALEAMEQSPDYPPNRLVLAEALAAIQKPERSREVYAEALELARRRLQIGDPDASEWVAEAEKALKRRE